MFASRNPSKQCDYVKSEAHVKLDMCHPLHLPNTAFKIIPNSTLTASAERPVMNCNIASGNFLHPNSDECRCACALSQWGIHLVVADRFVCYDDPHQ